MKKPSSYTHFTRSHSDSFDFTRTWSDTSAILHERGIIAKIGQELYYLYQANLAWFFPAEGGHERFCQLYKKGQ